MLKAAKAYFETQVTTTTQGDLLIMLYDGAIKYLNQAKDRMREKDYAQKGLLISKAMDVISELDESLNAEKGGEVAQNLHQLYFYCNARLLRANLEMNPGLVDEVVRILTALREAFERIKGQVPATQLNAQGAQAPSTGGQGQAAPQQTQQAQQSAPTAPEQQPQPPEQDAPSKDAAPAPEQPQAPQQPAAPKPAAPAQGYGPKPNLRPVRKPMPGTYGPQGGYR